MRWLPNINHHNGSSVGESITDSFLFIFGTFQEEAYSHRDNRPDTRCEQGQQSTQHTGEEDVYPGMRFVVDVFAVTSQFGDDRCPIVGSAGNNGSSRYSLGSVGSSFCSCGFCSSCFSGSRCVAGSFSGKREVYAGSLLFYSHLQSV